MNVVGHYDPVVLKIATTMKMPERFGNHFGNVRPAQMARACAAVEVTLNLAPQFSVGLLALLRAGIGGQSAHCFCVLTLKAKQHFPWQRVRQPESDEVRGTLAFDMRKVAARVDAAAKRIGWFSGNTGCPQGELQTLEPRIAPFEVHALWIASRARADNPELGTIRRLPVGDTADKLSALQFHHRRSHDRPHDRRRTSSRERVSHGDEFLFDSCAAGWQSLGPIRGVRGRSDNEIAGKVRLLIKSGRIYG
jgi:hypothetical protein